MKKIAVFIFSMFLLTVTKAQSYYVIHVKGEIKVKDTGQNIKAGDKLEASSKLQFSTQEALAVVLSKESGRMVLNGKDLEKSEDGAFWSIVKNALVPMKNNAQMSTRGASTEIINFQDYFGSKNFAIIGEELKLKVSEGEYPIDDEKIFVYRYEFNGKAFNKVMDHEEQDLVFNKNKLYQSKGEEIDPTLVDNVEIYYYNRATGEQEKTVSFQPIFLEEAHLEKEMRLILNFMRDNGVTNHESLKEELVGFVSDIYGRVDIDLMNEWLEEKDII